jgi:hypothetical protein
VRGVSACRRKKRMITKFSFEKLKERGNFKEFGVERRMILKESS